MSIFNKIFEVKVKVGQITKMYHFERHTQEQAIEAASKHGRILGVRKINRTAIIGNIERLNLREEPMRSYLGGGIYEDELKIDELLGFRKKENRRSKIERDKEHQKGD